MTPAAKEKKLEMLALRMALGEVLSDWPSTWRPETVIKNIGADDRVVVWQPFEYWGDDEVAEQIRSVASIMMSLARQAHKEGLL